MAENTYNASHIANFFLKKAVEDDKSLTQMKLQKLVYIGYGWVLAVLGKKLFEESICAWQHGPVIRSLYNEFKHFGNNPINIYAVEFDLDKGEITEPHIGADENDEPLKVVLEKVWDIYKDISAWTLRNKTHEEGTPWKKVYNEQSRNTSLKDSDIKNYFELKITDYLNG